MRKDGKNSYQAKKEKLLKIKEMILKRNELWKQIIAKQYKGDPNKETLLMPNDLIKAIWELIKDEK